MQVAKPVEPERISFKSKAPNFDPRKLYQGQTLAAYNDPSTLACEARAVHLPRVKVNATRANKFGLFNLLDGVGRLAIFSVACIVNDLLVNGLFAVIKDAVKDRLILDARVPNLHEVGLKYWTRTMATIFPLLGVWLRPGEVLSLSAVDLSDFYYQFIISFARSLRNVFKGTYDASELRHLKCFDARKHKGRLMVGLNTMAMGDENAVEFGQRENFSAAARAGAIHDNELLCIRGKAPRTRFFGGVIQDDFAGFEIEQAASRREILDRINLPYSARASHTMPKHILSPEAAAGSILELRVSKLMGAYKVYNMILNNDKFVKRCCASVVWGGDVDGCAGLVRPPPPRLLALAVITLQVCILGVSTVALLEVITGSWNSALLYRRRMMCLLDIVYSTCKGLKANDVVQLSPEAVTELLTIAILSPLIVTNLRATPIDHLYAVDASNWGIAVCRARQPQAVVYEMTRHCLCRGGWVRALGRADAWARSHDLLDEFEQLPETSQLSDYVRSQSLFIDWVRSTKFETVAARPYKGRRPHINVGELNSTFAAEIDIAVNSGPSSRAAIVGDSSVAGCSVTKGRSSSENLNGPMQQHLPTVVAYDLYTGHAIIPSRFNVADDPTRHVPLREPDIPVPDWLADLAEGKHELLDEILSANAPEAPTALEALEKAVPTVEPDRALRYRALNQSKTIAGSPLGLSGRVLHPDCKINCGKCDKVQRQAHAESQTPTKCAKTARDLLLKLGADRFLISPKYKNGDNWANYRGALDLFSGCKRAARRLVRRGCPWVLTYDNLDDPIGQDLLRGLVRAEVELIAVDCFVCVGAGPVCSSLSVAITPPVRTSEFPEGLPGLSESMQTKVSNGNSFAYWIAKLVLKHSNRIWFWVENPDSSFLWRLKPWVKIASLCLLKPFRVDFCRYGTPWRKRTRFLTNLDSLIDCTQFCAGCPAHTVLRGSSPSGVAWTKVAEPYPHGLADLLAAASSYACGWSSQAPVPDHFASRASSRAQPSY